MEMICILKVKACSHAEHACKKQKNDTAGPDGDGGHRSHYLAHAKRALYHLSYVPFRCKSAFIAKHINLIAV